MTKTICDGCGKEPHFNYYSTVKSVNSYSSTNAVEREHALDLCIECFEAIENAAYQKYLELQRKKEAQH